MLEKATTMEGLLSGQSIYSHGIEEALRHKWIESERARRDLGDTAIRQWAKDHWPQFVRERWMQHIEGTRYWQEFDDRDFGLLQRLYSDHSVLLDRVLDRLKAGQENLDVLQWGLTWNMPMQLVVDILQALDINSCRLACRFAE